jgi:thymidylate synthase
MNDIYRQLCGKISVQGHEVAGTKELRNSGFTLLDITDNIATVRTSFSLSYMLGELAWYFTGREDVEFISKFSSFWERISDDGVTNRSAYGAIVFNRYGFDQVAQVIDTLKRDPYSRRAVINFNVPNPERFETKDEICTIALVFELRDGKLDCTGIMRSNDVWLGTPYDVVFFTELQKHIANELGVAYGKYTHFSVSLHAYMKDIDRVHEVWGVDNGATRLKFDIEKFLAHISEIEHIAMSSDEPRSAVSEYCLNNAIVTEVNDED